LCTGRPRASQAADLGRSLDRRIVALAVPAFFALVTEPLFLLADSAIVGHLGTPELAGLGVASVVLRFAVGMCVFLAYGTTAAVAREVGAGQRAHALAQGVDGLWLAVLVGVVGTAAGVALTGPLVAAFGTPAEVADQATTYLRLGWLGLTPMLVVLAATGVLRGLHDTRTPLVVAVAANLANIALNLLLVYGLDLGIAGSAIGTDLAQLAAAAALVAVVVRGARREGAPLRPDLPGVRRSARAGGPLVVRTLSLQVCLVAMTWAAAGLGSTAVATNQLAMSVWTFLAFALDAVAIAAQAITGTALGAGDRDLTRRATDRIIRIGLVAGTVTGVLLALVAPVLGPLFTDDPDVVSLLGRVLLVAAVFQPVAGVVFVLDGVLIGAGDGRYLAIGGSVVTVLFVPVVLLLAGHDATARLTWLWCAFGLVFLGGRAMVLVTRARGDRWMVVGSGTGRTGSEPEDPTSR
jgi:putative MATE family efflux protein